jgi:aryl-alcohol dehydrogenase-like predicted oxidoreductase
LDVTVLGLGAWAIGGSASQGGWGPQDDAESVAAIHRAVELGINWIDTAPAYGFGHAEHVVGEALAALPEDERPLVFTKCGLVWEEGETTVRNALAQDSIRRECEASLRRLKVERLDLLQIHWPAHDGTPPEESWQTMAELVEEGKTRAVGVSNYDVELLERCEAVRHVDSYQPELNLIARDAEDGIAWCRANGTGVIVYSPMRSGLLTGTSTPERWAALPDDDWRRGHPDFQEPALSRNLALVEHFRTIRGSRARLSARGAPNRSTDGSAQHLSSSRRSSSTGSVPSSRRPARAPVPFGLQSEASDERADLVHRGVRVDVSARLRHGRLRDDGSCPPVERGRRAPALPRRP